jgi:putative hydrolase of the HAD superfamily
MNVSRALLIDLDDTLYDEASYVRSGMTAVAWEICRLPGAPPATVVVALLLDELNRNGRGKVFDVTLQNLGIAPHPDLIKGLLEAYRDHRPDILLWPGVRESLEDLGKDHRLAIVTDGLGVMQRRKVNALGVETLVDAIVYCWELGWPKPDPRAYLRAMEQLASTPELTLVVGDNPGHDMAAARAAGLRSLRVRSGRFGAHSFEALPADAEAESFVDAPPVIRRMEITSCPTTP